ncbi:ABC transporter permease subunit [Aliivibrio fischeri]|uniref:ABC transporter permease subunit n=1 Tax=Aliivibrio fischeri TaxID=668 RepID=UPI001F3B0255|nr:ABC transporter permease subunit [Aliivibrio fischeri]MCE7556864.1 ABC transporter permease subunit [Aliivibrio fischeri]MCE7563322.1 ABC transporter permease subunit [Aliivibrio fischeri]MCE7570257.1 ABC transporter permease subunit [Aliivibrio fischeri]
MNMVQLFQRNQFQLRGLLILILPCVFLWVGIGEPLKQLLIRSISDNSGQYVGVQNFVDYFSNSGLVGALLNSVFVSVVVMIASVGIAFLVAFGLVRSQLWGKLALQSLIQIPLFVPSIFPCLGLIYLLGGQGLITQYLVDFELYGPVGVILGGIIFTLPHAVLLLTTTLRGIDSRLYQAASSLGASSWQQFISITLSNSIYGIISACFVVFTLTMTDFGIAKVLAGQYPMLATEIYKQVIGQQNFSMGATISLVLIIPTCIAFFVDSWARKKQARLANNQIFQEIPPSASRDVLLTILCWVPCFMLLSVIGVVVWGSLISYWPYDFTFTWLNYDFDAFGYGWQPYWNSLILAGIVAAFGVIITFGVSYASQRLPSPKIVTDFVRFLALLPLSIPGTVLGLAYIFAFNQPDSWLNAWQGTFAFLAFNTIIHLFSVSFLTFNSTIGRLDTNYEHIGRSLSVPQWMTLCRVIVPLSKLTLLDIFFYLFVNTLTTVSAVVFLYGSNTVLASIVILNMDDSGNLAAASSMGSLLLFTALLVKFLHVFIIRVCR